MREKLFWLHRALKPTGTLYLHCDAHWGSYLAVYGLDTIFGRTLGSIVWRRCAGQSNASRNFAKVHDMILLASKGPGYFRFHGSVWDDIPGPPPKSERVGWPTQKPEALLERVILNSSDRGDLVLDPFCGSGTTLVAAQRLGRRWIGIDASEDAILVAKERLAA